MSNKLVKKSNLGDLSYSDLGLDVSFQILEAPYLEDGTKMLFKIDDVENFCAYNLNDFADFGSILLLRQNDTFFFACIDKAKNEDILTSDSYNLENTYNEYYITSVPWINFTSVTHPIPEDVSSLSVPRICFGKFVLNNEKYEMPFNITVSHVFVDGFHISKFLKKIEGYLDNVDDILR